MYFCIEPVRGFKEDIPCSQVQHQAPAPLCGHLPACTGTCLPARAPAHMHGHLPSCIGHLPSCMGTCLPVRAPACLHMHLLACMPTFPNTVYRLGLTGPPLSPAPAPVRHCPPLSATVRRVRHCRPRPPCPSASAGLRRGPPGSVRCPPGPPLLVASASTRQHPPAPADDSNTCVPTSPSNLSGSSKTVEREVVTTTRRCIFV